MLEFTGLPHGNYILVETVKPDGYDFPEDNEDGETPVTFCYTSGECGGECCNADEAEDLKACDSHANHAANKTAVSVTNVRRAVQVGLPVAKAIDGRSWTDADHFQVVIEPYAYQEGSSLEQTKDLPLPTCGETVQTTIEITKSDPAAADSMFDALYGLENTEAHYDTFCPMTFTKEGVYYYKIYEKSSDEAATDLIYDDTIYLVWIQIGHDGSVLAEQGISYMEFDSDAVGPSTRAIHNLPVFVNRYESLTVAGLQETKRVIGHDAAQGDFTFSVEADTEEAAELAGLSGLAESLTGAKYYSTTHTLTFQNGQSIDDSQTATTVRSANRLTLTAANVGKEYVYIYKELAVADSPWHQQQETVWRVTVSVGWVDTNTKDAIKADLTLEKSTDGEESWQQVGSQTYSSAEGALNPTDPLTVWFVNEYGSTLQIVKTDQDKKPLAGAKFTVKNEDSSYSETATTTLSEDGTVAAATFENIPDGTYTITETVPTGYQKINDMKLEIEGNTASLTWADTGQTVGEGSITKINGVFTIEVMNYINPDLPSTGSSGTVLMGGLGTAAIVLAGAWLLKQRGIDLGKFTSR